MTKPDLPAATDPRWKAVAARDKRADGQFFYAVVTTGVYCCPSCPSRLANVENVRFFASAAEAEAAGFRPCKRCRPDRETLTERHAAQIAQACRYIETTESAPTLQVLAQHVGLSTFHFHRLFKAATGLTPKAYIHAVRSRHLRERLALTPTVTEAIYDAGYGSNGRFYEQSNQLLGMTPTRYRAGGAEMSIHFAVGICSLGDILVAESGKGICAILLGDDADTLVRQLQDQFPRSELLGGDAEFEQRVAQVVGFVESPASGLALPLDIRGTAFQQRVWQALCAVPAGSTVSYAEVAQAIGSPKAVRAVAGACAANVLAVAIPCHRVIRNDGALSGYRWGVERKQALLQKEADSLSLQGV